MSCWPPPPISRIELAFNVSKTFPTLQYDAVASANANHKDLLRLAYSVNESTPQPEPPIKFPFRFITARRRFGGAPDGIVTSDVLVFRRYGGCQLPFTFAKLICACVAVG